MSPLGKIYSYPNNPRVQKVQIAAKYNNVVVEEVENFVMGQDNKSSAFLQKFPLGKVPAFETPDGFTLYESNAIAYYVAASNPSSKLLGKTKEEAAQIEQFIFFADNEIMPAQAAWIYPIFGFMQFNKAATEKAKTDIKKLFEVLNKHFLRKTYLVGECITLADITLVCALLNLYRMVLEPEFRKPFGNVNRWFNTCIHQSEFKAVLGVVNLCEKMQVFTAPKKDEKKKEEKKKEEKKPATKAEEDEEVKPKEEKKKNPLDLLPPSKLIMDEWKKVYSNNDTRPTALKWFWEHYDPEGYSIWRCDYKYNEELAMTFMSSNLVGGFFQRLESARKYAFGSLCILGEDNNNGIHGYFVFRGSDVPEMVKDAPDFESFHFVKVDPLKDHKHKNAFEAYLAWDKTIEGKKFADGKVFK